MIKSFYHNQDELLKALTTLYEIESFDVDLTYGNGSFYKNMAKPKIKIDCDPQYTDVIKDWSWSTGLSDESQKNIIYDPPFLTYVRNGRNGNGRMVMAKRFAGYWRYDELQEDYTKTIIEAHRILQKKGTITIKCQDIVHNHKMHATHININKWAEGLFRLKDLFILAAKHRMPINDINGAKKKKQRHARIHHSYFMVMEKI